MTLGDKGGIGKSFIAALIAQYYLDNVTDVDLTCLDLDPKNKTFSRYAGLDVDFLDVQTDGDIDKMKFDLFVNRVLTAGDKGEVIADVGGNIYISLSDYLRVNEVLQLFIAEGVGWFSTSRLLERATFFRR
jgi:cellulose biosynthesis protein BcsQ